MNKQPCYCNKCKGAVVSKRTFHRHLIKEQHSNKYKQNPAKKDTAKKVKIHEHFDVYSDQPLSSLPSEPISYDDDVTAATSHNIS